MPSLPRVRSALLFSDVHLGWAICSSHHARWLSRLPEAVGDAELIVLNGDIVDGYRGVQRAEERDLVQRLAELVAGWRREGRRVVYLEGNHDALPDASQPLRPEGWSFDFETDRGERVRVLHGHRFSESEHPHSAYDRVGRRVLALENFLYGRLAALRTLHRLGPGWLGSAVCWLECSAARWTMPTRLLPHLGAADVLVHGHTHFGPGRGRIGALPTWRTGSFVSPGHIGTADRMLRYRAGRFERIGWSGGSWRAFDDGR